MAREQLISAMKELKLTVHDAFIPFSKSRNKAKKQVSLNWLVTLKRDSYSVLTTDYMAGCAHAPSYRQGDNTVMIADKVKSECETGLDKYRKPISPDACDVIYSLVSDADVLNYSGFENWAQSFGYDTDSRKAEKIYHDCLENTLKLRNTLGDQGLATLQEACQDY